MYYLSNQWLISFWGTAIIFISADVLKEICVLIFKGPREKSKEPSISHFDLLALHIGGLRGIFQVALDGRARLAMIKSQGCSPSAAQLGLNARKLGLFVIGTLIVVGLDILVIAASQGSVFQLSRSESVVGSKGTLIAQDAAWDAQNQSCRGYGANGAVGGGFYSYNITTCWEFALSPDRKEQFEVNVSDVEIFAEDEDGRLEQQLYILDARQSIIIASFRYDTVVRDLEGATSLFEEFGWSTAWHTLNKSSNLEFVNPGGALAARKIRLRAVNSRVRGETDLVKLLYELQDIFTSRITFGDRRFRMLVVNNTERQAGADYDGDVAVITGLKVASWQFGLLASLTLAGLAGVVSQVGRPSYVLMAGRRSAGCWNALLRGPDHGIRVGLAESDEGGHLGIVHHGASPAKAGCIIDGLKDDSTMEAVC
jgi:hypothetical protein